MASFASVPPATAGLAVAAGGMILIIVAIALSGSVIHRVLGRRAARFRDAEREVREEAALREELGEREERLRLALDVGGMGTWLYDPETDSVTWDARQYQLFGLDPATPVRSIEMVFERIYPEDRPGIERDIARAVAGEAEIDTDFRIVRPDGEVRWLSAKGAGLRDRTGRVARLIGLDFDITERREAEADREFLLELGAELQTTRDPDAIAEIGTRRVGERIPAAACLWARNDPERGEFTIVHEYLDDRRQPGIASHLGRFPLASLHPELRREFEAGRTTAISDATTDPRSADDYEELYRPRGVRASLALPLVREGRWVGGMIVLDSVPHDWTEQEIWLARAAAERIWPTYEAARAFAAERTARAEAEAAEERTRFLYEQALAASKAKSNFLTVMSHELRTPLNAITGYTELVQDGLAGPVTERQKEFLDKVKANARHQLRVIEEILEFSRMESGREELQLQRVDVADLLRDVASFAEPLAREKDLGFRIHAPREPVSVEIDPAKVRHILLNLLSNAVKFTERGEIELRARVSGGALQLQVRDPGIGIRAEDQEKIFEPFVQVEEATTREKGGTGLGLAVARRLARMHGGDVSVESEVGRGSTFTVDLPADGRRSSTTSS